MKAAAVDFHCHLDLYPDPLKIVEQCVKSGSYILSVTTTPKAWHGTLRLVGDNKRIKTALGLHPQLAHERLAELSLFDSLLSETRYVGEIGLDGSVEWKGYWSEQTKVFGHILSSASRDGGRILSIHSRRAVTPVLDALENEPDAGIAVLHWFSGTKAELKRAIALGCWFSVGSAMVQGNRGLEMISLMPQNRVITETDGPFGMVEGKPLLPADTDAVTQALSKTWAVNQAEVANIVLDSFRTLVGSKVGGRA